MIPFERENKLNASEEYAETILDSNWDYVVRTTPGMLEDLEEKYPQICDVISREVRQDAQRDISDIFRPGVPDFLAFNDTGEYTFVEVKMGGDGLRHTQLKWLKDFNQVESEVWFTRPEKIEEKMDAGNIEAYTFNDKKGSNSENKVRDGNKSKLLVEIPKTLSSVIQISSGDTIKWRLKNKDELILDSK